MTSCRTIQRGAALRKMAAAGLLAALTLHAPPAAACGGTFCDGGPTAMPVDQTGENILFVVDEGMVEAHIQIQYEGDAERFAWVLPLPAVPDDIRIGSGPLFMNLLNGTVPTYGYSTLCGGQATIAVNGGGGVVDSPAVDRTDPLVVITKVVGAFEVSILEGGTADEVIAWLADNGYEQIPAAEAIFEEYVDQEHVFAAIKLTGGTGIDEIHPIVVRYPGDEPCVPLKLTRVAAKPDMGVRVFFLGTERYVPSNYKHVTLNPAVLDWSTFASNYQDVVTRAVDTEVADGHAFVTEYAGSSAVVTASGVYTPSWDAEAYLGLSPAQLLETLEVQGLLACAGARCSFNHPLIEPLLDNHLPPPEGVDAHAFYDCVSCYAGSFDAAAFDSTGFALDFMERIIVPGRDAAALLSRYPFLTRMYTTISPDEMTVDPLFHTHGMDAVSNVNQVVRALGRDASSAYQVSDDWVIELTQDGSWPKFDEDMPYAWRIEEYAPDGEVIELVDFSDEIQDSLDVSNENQDYAGVCAAFDAPIQTDGGESASNGSGGTSASGGSAGNGGANASGGSAGSAGSAGSGGGDSETIVGSGSGNGCSCRSAGSSAPDSPWWALGLCGFWWARRRGRAVTP